jgi:DNA invertase Pin-like site-specific DNA recombinase
MEKILRVAAYPRVSSSGQRDAGSIRNQEHALPQVIASHSNWRLVRPIEHYADDGKSASSGKLSKRKGFAKLLRDVENGELDLVVVADFDRITRAEDLKERGFILGTFQQGQCLLADTTNQVIDLNSMEGDLIAGMRTSQSADYIRKLRKRVREGHDRAIRDGRKPSGPTPFGLVFKNKEWSIDPVAAAILTEIFERVCRRESYIDIARDFQARGVPTSTSRQGDFKGFWSREKVHKMVNKTYLRGEWLVRSRPRTIMKVPVIISDELWDEAHSTLASYGKRGLVKTKHTYLADSLIICGLCGSRLGISRGFVTRTTSYICNLRRRPNERVVPHVRCNLRRIPQKQFDDKIWELLRSIFKEPGEFEEELLRLQQQDGVRDWAGELRGHERELAKMEEDEVVLMDSFSRGKISQGAMDKMLDKMTARREALGEHIRMARSEAAKDPGRNADAAKAAIANIRTLLSLPSELPAKTKRALVRTVVEKIVVREADVAVYYNTALDVRGLDNEAKATLE